MRRLSALPVLLRFSSDAFQGLDVELQEPLGHCRRLVIMVSRRRRGAVRHRRQVRLAQAAYDVEQHASFFAFKFFDHLIHAEESAGKQF
jgi:hypothetical protein